MEQGLLGLSPKQAVETWGRRVTDPRPRVATGYPSFDELLNRGGFAPGELVILAGRTRTRKTTVTLNIIANMLRQGVKVGFVGLDETPASYVAKLASVLLDVPFSELEDRWDDPDVREHVEEYKRLTKLLTLSKGYRPMLTDLTRWKGVAESDDVKMQVVFLDYVSLMTRDKYAGAEVQRVGRLIEELQVWANTEEVVLVALHQVGRLDEGSGGRYHGDTPMSLEGLKYGGEEVADIVLGTYRPALDPVGHLNIDEARAYFPDSWKMEKVIEAWELAVDRVEKYKHSTFLQLLKNRPGVETNFRGVELLSPTRSQRMQEKAAAIGADMKYRPVIDAADDVVRRVTA